jgi:hypothetical protein
VSSMQSHDDRPHAIYSGVCQTCRASIPLHPKVNDRFDPHFTPTAASWIDMVECWFAEITRERIRRGTFRGVSELIVALQDLLLFSRMRSCPLIWTATASFIINQMRPCKRALETGH